MVWGGNGLLWQQGPFPSSEARSSRKNREMQSDNTPDQPTARPVSLRTERRARRGLRLREGLALGLLATLMAMAWIVTLAG